MKALQPGKRISETTISNNTARDAKFLCAMNWFESIKADMAF